MKERTIHMKEKSYVARLGALALVLTLMTTCLTGGTLAKFVTEVEGTATATVAAWNFEAAGNGTEFTGIDMGRTAYEGDTIKDTVLAPGTKGSFDIVLDGSGSGVGIGYSVTITAASDVDLPADLIFNVDNITYNLGDDITGTINYADGTDAMKKTITVNWEWDYGTDDTAALNDNDYAGKSWTLDIKATGTQVEPTSTTA
jgi:hypothetical protein